MPTNGLFVSPGQLPCLGQSNVNANQAAVDCSNIGPNNVARVNNYNATANGGNWWNNYRPLTQYGDVYLITHGGFANYNSLQVSWQKQSGPITFLTNYTFSKVLGTRDGQTDNGAGNGKAVDPFNLKNNYGTLAYDHTHVVNLSYVWNLPKFIHGSKFVEGAINGWQISGFTTYSAGAPIQPNTGGNLNRTANGLTFPTAGAPSLPDNTVTLPNGLKSSQVNSGTWVWYRPERRWLYADCSGSNVRPASPCVGSVLQFELLCTADSWPAGYSGVAVYPRASEL
jgi:hypothetical protein